MLDFLTYNYSLTLKGKQNKFKSFVRYILRYITNFCIPFLYNVQYFLGRDKKLILNSEKGRHYIVSLTTFPGRIDKVWIVIETLLRQKCNVNEIVLWLSKEQFSNDYTLPKKLIRLQKKGVRIEFCEGDLRSHKKYFYSMKEHPNSYVITVDDDVFYCSGTIGALIRQSKKYPGTVCINRGWRITYDKCNNILPYRNWSFLYGEVEPSYNILQTGVGAVLYPPKVLYKLLLEEKLFLEHCKLADDIWLYFMGNLNGTKVTKTKNDFLVIPILNFNRSNQTLTSVNVGENLNDKQFKSMLELIEKLEIKELYNRI